MIFIKDPNKIYAKVWKVDKKEKYTAVSISTSDKQQDGSYKNSSWNCRLVGKAHDVEVAEGDKLIINSAKIENIYDKEKNRSWLNIIVFDADVGSVAVKSDNEWQQADDSFDELPF